MLAVEAAPVVAPEPPKAIEPVAAPTALAVKAAPEPEPVVVAPVEPAMITKPTPSAPVE